MSVKQSPHEEYDRGFSNGWDACAARAQPAQVGRVLTLDEVRESVHEAGLDWHNGWTMGEDAENRYLNLCRAIEQAVLAKRGPQWLPIETAPKDEAVWLGSAIRQQAFVGQWKDYMRHNSPQVTHWMRLPPPPGIVGEKEGA